MLLLTGSLGGEEVPAAAGAPLVQNSGGRARLRIGSTDAAAVAGLALTVGDVTGEPPSSLLLLSQLMREETTTS